MVLRVVLLAQGDEDLVAPPGRDLLVRDTHTFADLAAAIDRAFARWDLLHEHEFRLGDGRRIGDTFEYVFDFGDSWEHRCTVLRREVDPAKESGASQSEIVPVFGWGTIPDQYGRTTGQDDE
jgi:hypothetical protein